MRTFVKFVIIFMAVCKLIDIVTKLAAKQWAKKAAKKADTVQIVPDEELKALLRKWDEQNVKN